MDVIWVRGPACDGVSDHLEDVQNSTDVVEVEVDQVAPFALEERHLDVAIQVPALVGAELPELLESLTCVAGNCPRPAFPTMSMQV